MALAMVASVKPWVRAKVSNEIIMVVNVHQIHNRGQVECAFDAVAGAPAIVHITHMATTTPKTFLREWRKWRKLTLEQAAELVDLSHSQLSRIERGSSDYTRSTLEALAKIYVCEPGDLLSKDPTAPSATIVEIWDHIPAAQRETAAKVLRSFTKNGS